MIGSTFTIDDARAQRKAFRDAAKRYGRDSDEIKFFAGMMITIAKDGRTAIGRQLSEITKLIKSGSIKTALEKTYAFTETNQAINHVATGRAKGKIVVRVRQ